MSTPRIFLLSPASCAGRRANGLLSPRAAFDLARRLREGNASLGEAFSAPTLKEGLKRVINT